MDKLVEKENQVHISLSYILYYLWKKHNPNKSHAVGIQAGEVGGLLAPLLSYVFILMSCYLCLKETMKRVFYFDAWEH